MAAPTIEHLAVLAAADVLSAALTDVLTDVTLPAAIADRLTARVDLASELLKFSYRRAQLPALRADALRGAIVGGARQ